MYTYHSIVRAQERTRYSGVSAVRFVENGTARGKGADEFSQREREYLMSAAKGNCYAKAYNGYCLIINEHNECVTLYQLPDWFGKRRFYQHKQPIRDPRAYASFAPARVREYTES